MSLRAKKKRRLGRAEHKPLGFLTAMPGEKGYRVVCKACAAKGHSHGPSPVFPVNLRPYKQHCAVCKKSIIQGGSVRDLFDGT